MSKKFCPTCFSNTGLRTIFYGMPASEPDPAKYVIGGCVVEENAPEMECIECHWTGSRASTL